MVIRIIINPKFLVPCSNAVGGGLEARLCAISPNMVFPPVLVMSTFAEPLITDEPFKTVLAQARTSVSAGEFTVVFFDWVWFAGQQRLINI